MEEEREPDASVFARTSYAWKYGYVMGSMVAKVLAQSSITLASAYTTPGDVLKEGIAAGKPSGHTQAQG